jgi:hypothetical protein
MSVDTPAHRFHNRKGLVNPLKDRQRSLEQALEEAVSRALRDNLAPLQRTADELHQAYGDLVAACSSSRPSNALPAMLRAQTAASSLAAGLSVLSNFVAVALKPRADDEEDHRTEPESSAIAVAEPSAVEEPEAATAPPSHSHRASHHAPVAESASDWVDAEYESTETTVPSAYETRESAAQTETKTSEHEISLAPVVTHQEIPVEAPIAATPAFDLATLPTELQDLHRRANRVAKVAMQDIKLLQPKDVRLARENKDICTRLRPDLDKARKEYDRRFRAIQDHPVDYFHHWLVEILAEGDRNALGEYPYPSPVPHHS